MFKNILVDVKISKWSLWRAISFSISLILLSRSWINMKYLQIFVNVNTRNESKIILRGEIFDREAIWSMLHLQCLYIITSDWFIGNHIILWAQKKKGSWNNHLSIFAINKSYNLLSLSFKFIQYSFEFQRR